MKLRLAFVGLLLTTTLSPALAQTTKRAWTPETSVSMRHIALDFEAPQHWPSPQNETKGALFSPDRKHFLAIEYHGDIADDAAVAKLRIFASADIRDALAKPVPGEVRAVRELEMRSHSPQHAAMSNVHWDDDGTAVLFHGVDQQNVPHLYRFDLRNGTVRALVTLPDTPGARFEVASGGGATAFFLAEDAKLPQSAYPGSWVNRDDKGAMIFSDLRWAQAKRIEATMTQAMGGCDGQPARPIVKPRLRPARIMLAPSGCRALLVMRWLDASAEYLLLDLRSGKTISIARANTGTRGVLWSPDGKEVLLTDVAGPNAVAIFDVAANRLTAVPNIKLSTNLPGVGARWIDMSSIAIPKASGASEGTILTRSGSGWTARVGDAASLRPPALPDDGFEVSARQDWNTPTILSARSGNKEVLLSRPDPVLAGVARTDWRKFSWKDPGGKTHNGGLMLPPNPPADGRAPPLVVNPYWFEEYRGSHDAFFLPDGKHDGAESIAQTLAARGFAVLWMDGWNSSDITEKPNPDEGTQFVLRLTDALDELVRQKLIDPDRIGMTGFSRGGYMTLYAMTHPRKYKLRAGMSVDSFKGMLSGQFVDSAAGLQEAQGKFFENKSRWLENDTLTNVDRATGPMLFTTNENGPRFRDAFKRESTNERILLGAFVDAGVPVDQLNFPEGIHQLLLPRERLLLAGAIADWMAFWVKGDLPADPARAARWTTLRDNWSKERAAKATGRP